MAGIMTPGDEGVEVKDQSVPSIGGPAQIVQSAHVGDAMRAEGVNYNTDESIGVQVDVNEAYPAGTAMNDSTPSDDIN